MNPVFTKAGLRSLRLAWALLVLAVAAALAAGLGSQWNLDREKRNDVNIRRQLSEASTKVEVARRESDDLRSSAQIFEDLTRRGIMRDERRLEFLERVDRLKSEYHITGLEYEVLPQRALPLPGNRTYNALEVLGTRITVKIRALHEVDLIGFVDSLARPEQDFHFIDSCVMRRPITSADPLKGSGGVEGECTIEWISLKDKRGKRAS